MIHSSLARTLAVLVTAALGPTVAAQDAVPAGSSRASFESFGRQFLEVHGLDGAQPGELELQSVLDRHFVRADVGCFDLRVPAEVLADDARMEELQDVVVALLDLQEVWLGWRSPGKNGVPREVVGAFATARKFVRGWDVLEAAGGADLLQLQEPDEEQAAALELVRARCTAPEAIGPRPDGAPLEPAQIVLSPDREHFLRLVGFLGQSVPGARDFLWDDSVLTWTEFFLSYPRDVQVLAMEYASHDAARDPLRGSRMTQREKTGLSQHVVQRATFSLSWLVFGRNVDPVFEAGLAQNMAVEVLGENNCRSGGSGRGNVTMERSVFVPGGLPQGGWLPAWNADSRWREDLGEDYFVGVLRDAQKEGGKEAGRRASQVASFLLQSDDQSQELVVTAPFLGAAGRTREPAPQTFTADYLEFFRAYKSAFVHWLQSEAGGRKASAEKWAELLGRLASLAEGESFESVVAEVYGRPLSSPDAEEGSLELDFLVWLSKQR